MITLEYLSLENIVYFKNAHLPLNRNGITNILGRNKDSGSNRSNASGKSLLLRTLPGLLFSSSPVIIQDKQRHKKDLMGEKSSIELHFFVDGKRMSINKYNTRKAIKYAVIEENGDFEFRTQTAAETFLGDTFPLSEDDFYATVYIDRDRPSMFQMGTPAKRLELISSLFDLDVYDKLRVYFNEKISVVKEDQIKLSSIEGNLTDVSADTLKDKQIELKDLASKQDIVSKNLSVEREKEKRYSIYKSHQKQIQWVKSIVGDFTGTTQSDLKNKINSLKKQVQDHKEYKEYVEKDKFARKEEKRITWKRAKVHEFLDEHHVVDIDRWIDNKIALKNKTIENERIAADIKRKYPRLQSICTRFNKLLGARDVSDLDDDREDLIKEKLSLLNKIEQANTSIDHFSGHVNESQTCTVCHTVLSQNQVNALVKSSKSDVKKYNAQLRKVITELKQVDFMLTNLPAVQAKKQLDSLPVIAYDEKLFDRVVMSRDILNEIENTTIEFPVAVQKPDGGMREIQNSLRDHEKAYTLYTSNDWEDIEPKKFSRDKLNSLEEQYDDTLQKIASLKEEIRHIKRAINKDDEIRDQIQDLKEKTKHVGIYRTLVSAYSSRGIKRLAVQSIVKSIQNNINMYVPSILPSTYEFTWEVDPNGQKFDILVHRREKGKTITSDVANLSGAEGRAFNLLLPMAMLPLIPPRKRFNVMVLDEMTTGMDPTMKSICIHNLLPIMTDIVPHVIFITPDTDPGDYPHGYTYTVTREKGVSSLVAT